MTISHRILLRSRNVSEKICRENQSTHFVFRNFSPPEKRAVFEIIRKNAVEPDRPQMTIRRMRIACWIPKATDTNSEYIILIVFPRQWLLESASLLVYMFIACLVTFCSYLCIFNRQTINLGTIRTWPHTAEYPK